MYRIEYSILHTVTVIIMLAEDKTGQTPPVSSVILCSPPLSEPRTLCFCYCTCTDCNGLHELVSPGVRSHNQCQVGLLDQLVHCALCDTIPKKQKQEWNPSIIYIHRLQAASVEAKKYMSFTTWWQWHQVPAESSVWWKPHTRNK